MLARVVLSVSSIVVVLASFDGFISVYETAQIIEAEGYVSETHGILTDDGYMLEMHRIPFAMNETSGSPDRPVVLLMHGILGASNNFILLGPEYSIAYNLADAGFDVWMGNARGTRNSRQHVNLNPDDRNDRLKFFDFTWEEIGYTDVANMVDYILHYTNNTKLHYIGHSQGGTAFLVLTSMRAEYNDKILSAHLLAGVGYMEYFPNRLLRSLAMFTNTIYSIARRMGIVEMFPPPRNSSRRTGFSPDDYEVPIGENFDFNCDTDEMCRSVDYCTGDPRQKEMCELFGIEEIVSTKFLDNIQSEFDTGGAALKQIAHYGQNIQDKTFRRWNYGTMDNFIKYGSHQPPIYDISRITVKTTMHYTISDNLLDERDVLNMCAVMPKCEHRKIARDTFGHVDFVLAADVKELVTEYIIKHMLKAHDEHLNGPEVPITDKPGNSTDVPNGSSTIYPSIVIIYFGLLIPYINSA